MPGNLEIILDSFLSHTFYIQLDTKSYHFYLSQTHLTVPSLHWHCLSSGPDLLSSLPIQTNTQTRDDHFSLVKISIASYCLQQHFPTGKSPSKIKFFKALPAHIN